VAVAVHRLRERYRELVRLDIANTVATENEIDEELRHLLDVLSRG
jgi:RNA polymerase sigma-70 factor (ECF subfamily)